MTDQIVAVVAEPSSSAVISTPTSLSTVRLRAICDIPHILALNAGQFRRRDGLGYRAHQTRSPRVRERGPKGVEVTPRASDRGRQQEAEAICLLPRQGLRRQPVRYENPQRRTPQSRNPASSHLTRGVPPCYDASECDRARHRLLTARGRPSLHSKAALTSSG
jgi:hypothetical protein